MGVNCAGYSATVIPASESNVIPANEPGSMCDGTLNINVNNVLMDFAVRRIGSEAGMTVKFEQINRSK